MQKIERFRQEIIKAQETIESLKNDLHQIYLKLEKNPNSAVLMQEQKNIMLDMTITLNELEHSQTSLENCISSQS